MVKKTTGDAARRALARWMKNKKRPTSAVELAEQLGISNLNVHAYVAGRKRPGLKTAAALEKITGIPARKWAE